MVGLRFQLAALQVAFLCQMSTEADVRNSLKVHPHTLKEAYDKIYKRILTQHGSAPHIALNAFRWVKFSYEPLASKTLLDAVTAQIGKSGEFWQDDQTRITPDAILKFYQNFHILDEGLDVFRFTYLTVDEYLGTKLMVVESHVYISEICLSLLCSLHYPEKYDQTLRTDKAKYTDRHLLLYSAVFWPWDFSCCEGVNDYDSNILKIVWNVYFSV